MGRTGVAPGHPGVPAPTGGAGSGGAVRCGAVFRPSLRAHGHRQRAMGVELSPEEIDAYMLAAQRAILCVSRGEERAPLAVPMWFGWIDRRVVMHTLQASPKVGHIRRHPQVTCLVESGEHYYTLRAVQVFGRCEVSDDQADVARVREQINESKPFYRDLRPGQWPAPLERHYARPRVVLRITPERIVSWDFAKIRR